MAEYVNEVTKIEEQEGEYGPFKLLHIKGKADPKKVWGDIAEKFITTGTYKTKSEKNKKGQWVYTYVELLGVANGSSKPAPQTQAHAPTASRDRSIPAQCAMKAAAHVAAALVAVSGHSTTNVCGAIPEIMKAFMDAADELAKDTPTP